MKKSSNTVLYFSYYLFLNGMGLVFMPNMVTKMAQIPETTEVWIRVVGILTLILGFYYHQSASKNLTEFVKLTVTGRIIFFCGAVGLVVAGIAPRAFIGFGIIDLVTALWTRQTLKSENSI